MAILIGVKPDSDFSDPLGLLTNCHRRIEKFLVVLLSIANQARGKSLSDEQRDAVDTSLRYFVEAAPKHTADEEESLFPRMRARRHANVQAVLSDLDRLHADHITAADNHRTGDELFRRWIAEGRLPANEFSRLTSLLHSLRDAYARHIREEETRVFPLAARILTTVDLRAMGSEMAKRRGFSDWPSDKHS